MKWLKKIVSYLRLCFNPVVKPKPAKWRKLHHARAIRIGEQRVFVAALRGKDGAAVARYLENKGIKVSQEELQEIVKIVNNQIN